MTRRAQAEAVVDMLDSNTMDFSDPGKQRERLIELVEAALAEHAKAAPVSDVGALPKSTLDLVKTALEHASFALDGVVSLDDEDEGKDGGSDTCQHAKKTVDRALKKVNAFITSIKETGDAR
jgi:hypothetical protein